jgi:hypothetical protein
LVDLLVEFWITTTIKYQINSNMDVSNNNSIKKISAGHRDIDAYTSLSIFTNIINFNPKPVQTGATISECYTHIYNTYTVLLS